MRIVKRYPNRKLYDTKANSYTTLIKLAEHIRNGDQIQVFDHNSKDITYLTQLQILAKEECKNNTNSKIDLFNEIIRGIK